MKPEVKAFIDAFAEKDSEKLKLAQMKRAAECKTRVEEIRKAQPGISFHQAWEIAARENPELFKGEKEQAPAAFKAVNDLASKARAQAVAQVVQAVQARHPGLSFEESWQIARAEHSDLFEGSTSSAAGYAEFQDRCDALLKKMDAAIERTGGGPVKVIAIRPQS